MDGYQMRQGTVYRHLREGGRILLIHHDPMNGESLLLQERDGDFDVLHPARIALDSLIALRQSGEFEEMGDLAPEDLRILLKRLLSGGGLTEEAARSVGAILKESSPEQ